MENRDNIKYALLLRNLYLYRYIIMKKKITANRQIRKSRRFWVRKIYEERESKGEFHSLILEMKLSDHELFFKTFRMSPTTFEKLLYLIGPSITKQKTVMRDPVSAEERLAVTLRYLTTGDAMATIARSYRMSPETVRRITHETCAVIWENLGEYLKSPCTFEEWRNIAYQFETRWNFPNAVGAIDGKHVMMFAPPRSGSVYFNYKKTHSIVLMAICSAKYHVLIVDIGDSGRQSDGSVYNNSYLGYAIENNLLNIPGDRKLPHSQKVLPHVFVADDAFALKKHMMKPYPTTNLPTEKLIFNYRLSRARRVVENTFGIAASRFRVFHRPIVAKVDKVKQVTKAVVALHNFLMVENHNNDNYDYCPSSLIDSDGLDGFRYGEWRTETQNFTGLRALNNNASNNYSRDARLVRDAYKDYFNNEGAVEWQLETVKRV